jgi:hypothetical protein
MHHLLRVAVTVSYVIHYVGVSFVHVEVPFHDRLGCWTIWRSIDSGARQQFCSLLIINCNNLVVFSSESVVFSFVIVKRQLNQSFAN